MKDMEKLYKSIAPRLTNWLVSSGSQYDEACDIVQNTFLKIWKMRDDVRDDASSVSGLAFTIARNLRKNLVRDNSRLTFVGDIRDPDDGIGGETESPTVGMTAHLDALQQQRETSQSDTEYLRKRLLEAFAKLPPILRDAYTMFQVGEMSVRDIANQTGVSENLVKVRIFRAKEKLKTILADLHVTF